MTIDESWRWTKWWNSDESLGNYLRMADENTQWWCYSWLYTICERLPTSEGCGYSLAVHTFITNTALDDDLAIWHSAECTKRTVKKGLKIHIWQAILPPRTAIDFGCIVSCSNATHRHSPILYFVIVLDVCESDFWESKGPLMMQWRLQTIKRKISWLLIERSSSRINIIIICYNFHFLFWFCSLPILLNKKCCRKPKLPDWNLRQGATAWRLKRHSCQWMPSEEK